MRTETRTITCPKCGATKRRTDREDLRQKDLKEKVACHKCNHEGILGQFINETFIRANPDIFGVDE